MISKSAFIVAALSFGVSLAISVLLTPVVRRWASQRDFVDRPVSGHSHKRHGRVVPFGGGIAITVAILLPMVVALLAAVITKHLGPAQLDTLTRWIPQWLYWAGGIVDKKMPVSLAVIAGALIMHLMGIVDDHWPLPVWAKLIVQVAIALMLTAWFGIRAGEALGKVPATILTTLWIVALTNAFNLIDNMDGLSAGVAGLTAIVLALSALQTGQVFVPCMLLLVAGGALGFLVYNFPPASVFMGDAGSLVIGYLLAVGTVLTTFYDPDQQRTPFGIFAPLVVFAVPLYDMSSVIVRRYRSGISIFRPDRHHFSHRLVRLGLSPTGAVLTIYLATTATALCSILLPLVSWPGAVLIFGQCVCIVVLIAILESGHGQ